METGNDLGLTLGHIKRCTVGLCHTREEIDHK